MKGTPREMDSNTELEIPTLGRTLRLLGRALSLRCPHCGHRPVLEHYFKLRVQCGHCGLRLERGEHDYFAGSILLNYCLAGVIVVVGLAVLVLVNWPAVPWGAIQWGAPIAVLVLPFILYPFSKLLWLAADIAVRPVTNEELEWHRTAGARFSTERSAPR